MKRLNQFCIPIILSAVLLGSAASAATGVDYDEYARLLEKYVAPSGVHYADWAANDGDVSALDGVVDHFSEVDLASLSTAQQKAFYINLYNAAMLQAVLKEYPIQSVTKIGLIPFSIFKKNFIQQGDRELSLDDIEKGILLTEYFDARIHFAVNCASVSCPPLRPEPFVAEKLSSQLDEQTRLFAKTDHAAQVDNTMKRIAYSSLFKWYSKDFAVETPADYLNRFRDDLLPLDYKPSWIDYNWGLNQANESIEPKLTDTH